MDITADQVLSYVTENLRKITLNLYKGQGFRKNSTFVDLIKGIDAIHNTVYMPEFEVHGYTFFTRPRLNLTTTSLRLDRILRMVESMDINSVNFAIRILLDTNFVKLYRSMIDGVANSNLVNVENPFIPILSNKLHSLTGWPDLVLETEDSEGGYYSEVITYPIGHDKLSKAYELNATFSDVQGSVILTLFLIWTRYLFLLTEGVVSQYQSDTIARRMGFTSSIYRFVLDPSKMFITKWAKATGCFPGNLPIGSFFNYDSSAKQIEASKDLSIPFKVAGKIDYMDPVVLWEFNTLVRRYCRDIEKYEIARGHDLLYLNFKCIPFIDLKNGTNELQWRYNPEDPEVIAIKKAMHSSAHDSPIIDDTATIKTEIPRLNNESVITFD